MQLINGKELSKNIKNSLREKISVLDRKPCLAVIIIGNNPASAVYVRNKEKACADCGIISLKYELNENTSEAELLNLIDRLNKDNNVDGILVQLPLPYHSNINENKILLAINPNKDVDCFHPLNVGKVFSSKINNNYDVLPCTANGCLKLIKSVCNDLTGKHAVIIGRSNIVGKPVAQLLLNENCTTTIVHSKTRNISNITKIADILIVAVGKAKFLTADMIKNNAIVIDVGINRLEDDSICGDADFENLKDKCSYITPVPNGVGPMTVACLMENTYKFYLKHQYM